MDKSKQFKCYFLFFIGFFLTCPIFLSIGYEIGISSLSRVASIQEKMFFISIPLGYFFLLFLFNFRLIKPVLNAFFSLLSLLLLMLILFDYIIDNTLDKFLIKNYVILLAFFIIQRLISDTFNESSFLKSLAKIEIEKYFFLNPLLIHLIIIISSNFLISKKIDKVNFGVYLFDEIIIYNYEQYVSLMFIPFVFHFKNFILKIIYMSLLIYLLIQTNNITAGFVLLSFCLLLSFFFFLKKYKINQNFFLFLLMTFIIIFSVSYWLIDHQFFNDSFLGQRGLIHRKIIVENFFQNLNDFKILFPSLMQNQSWESDFHNQNLNFYYMFGIFVLIFFYSLCFKLYKIYILDWKLGLSLIAIILLGGTTTNNILHLNLAIYFGMIFGYMSYREKNKYL